MRDRTKTKRTQGGQKQATVAEPKFADGIHDRLDRVEERLAGFKATLKEAQRRASGAKGTENWLANAAHSITHFGSVELVNIEEAAYRLYVRTKRAPRGVERMPTLSEMRRVYDRTKGQVFVLDRAFDGMPDHGPLFVWDSLWRFAGCPEKGEKPTWRLPKGAFSDMPAATSCTPGRCLFLVRDYVKKLRGATARAEAGAAKAA